MNIQIPKQLLEIIKTFEENNFEIYIVGGAVRDILMGKAVYDWDLTTNATPEEMLKLFKDAYYENNFGMVGIPNEIEGERPYEVTTFRTEHGYSDYRKPDKVLWGENLEEDTERRDFTINATALKIVDSGKSIVEGGKSTHDTQHTIHNLQSVSAEIVDNYDGQKDIEAKLIRTVGDANERFREDALRMMRAVRIASETGFTIETKTLEAIKSNASLINKISRERIKDELFKILKSKSPYEGFLHLKETLLLQEILPEISKTFGVEQKSPGRHHIHDVGTHSFLSLKFVSEKTTDPVVRFATLVHDIGKPQTFKELENGTITFYNHEIIGARIVKRIAERLRFSSQETEKLYKLVRYHQFTVDERQTDSAVRRFITNIGKENVADMILLRIGDRLGGGARETSWRLEAFKKRLIEVQKQPFRVQDLKISGNDVMEILKIPSGPKVGEVLIKLFEEVVNKKIENKKENLISELKKLLTKVNNTF